MNLMSRLLGSMILRAPADEGGGSAPAAAAGPLSIDAATQMILGAPETDAPAAIEAEIDIPDNAGADTQPAETDTQSEAAAQTAEDDLAPETASEGAEAEQAEPETPAIEPPHFWAAEDKVEFAKLPPSLQQKVADYAKAGDKAAATAIQQAAQARKQAEDVASGALQSKAQLDKLMPEIEQNFTARWAGVDLLEIAKVHGTETADQIKAQYAAEMESLNAIRKATQEANDSALQAHQAKVLPEIVKAIPDLADPVRGPALAAELETFLGERGYSAERLKWADAEDYSLACDAMRWRKHQATQAAAAKAAKVPPKPAPTPTPQRTSPVRPTAAPVVAPAQQRAAEQARNRFAQTRSVSDATAAILAMSKG